MLLDLFLSLVTANGFERTDLPSSQPVVVHGVPGSGKSFVIRSALKRATVAARTAGVPQPGDLNHPGILPLQEPIPHGVTLTICDEYQLLEDAPVGFHVLFGDPFQGNLRLRPHYTKAISSRVPRPVCQHLQELQFQISSSVPGKLITSPAVAARPRPSCAPAGKILHLGPISHELLQSHHCPSEHPRAVQGLEYDLVTLVFHSSELHDRVGFYVACTRARSELRLISDYFHELKVRTDVDELRTAA